MKTIKAFTSLLAAATLALSACGASDSAAVVVGASPVPHAQILKYVKENLAKKAGIEIEIKEYQDYNVPNSALKDGDIDANFFQHLPYLKEASSSKGYKFNHGTGVHIEPYGIYSKKIKDLKKLPKNAQVAITDDPSNQARALELLAKNGIITLPKDKKATIYNVEKNPKNITFKPAGAPSIPKILPDVDIAIINGNYALENGLKPSKDAIYLESGEGNPYANILAWNSAASGKKAPAPEVTRTFTVVLDPGHGGEDPGATGPMGTHEKTVVLAVAHKVKKLLAKEENLRVVLTRDDDYYVPLGKRVSKARGVRADLFVSIHADAFVKPDARGSSVFVLSNHGASSLGAKWLAHNENRADLIGGVNIKTASTPETASLLMDLYTTSQIRDSKVLAKRVLAELGQIGRLHKASVEQANFAVLRSPDVPSVLVETAFISNPDEEKRLRHPQYQDELARAIARGILDYRKLNPPGPRGKLS